MKCLNLLVHEFKTSTLWTVEIQSEKVIKWISDKVSLLDEKALTSKPDKIIADSFKREVT